MQHTFTGAVVSYDRYSTPFYKKYPALHHNSPREPVENQDFGLFLPDVGLFVADGVGKSIEPSEASRFVVAALGDILRREGVIEMDDEDMSVQTVNHALDQLDSELGRYIPGGATTLGALIFAKTHLVAIGIGDTPIYQRRAGALIQLTQEQGKEHFVYNVLAGKGRPNPNIHTYPDQVKVVHPEKSDKYMIVTDGLIGDAPAQRMPGEILGHVLEQKTAELAVQRLAELPADLFGQEFILPDGTFYQGKVDDLTVATLFVTGKWSWSRALLKR